MKIRNGFVSNSSSSSFIIGIGKVKDYERLKQYLKKNNIRISDNYSMHIKTTSELLEPKCWIADVDLKNGIVSTYAAVNSAPSVSTKFDPSKEDHYLIVNVGNDEGDDEFYNSQEDRLEYEKVNEDWFEGEQRELIDLLKSNLIEGVDYSIGAERNG